MDSKNKPSNSRHNGNDPSPFKKLKLNKPQSKFEMYGDNIINYLQYAKTTGDTKIHYYQIDAVLKTQGRLLEDSGKRLQGDTSKAEVQPVLIVAPTGSGKSGMIALLPYVLKSHKVLVISPSKVISNQLGIAFGKTIGKKSFFELTGIFDIVDDDDPGQLLETPKIISAASDVIQDREIVNNVVIVNAQKFGGNSGMSLVYKDKEIVKNVRKFFEKFDTLLVDEAHHYPAKTWENIVKVFSRPVIGMEKKIIFLTATPYRHGPNGRKMFILGTGPDAKKRVAYEIYSQDLEGYEIRVSTFKEKDSQTTLTNDIFRALEEQYQKEPRFRPQALVIVRTKVEAGAIAAELNKSLKDDHFAVAIVGGKQSDELTDSFTRGDYRVAVVCNLLKEGYDNPKVTLCVILRSIRSRILFSQFIGRCIRINRNISADGADMDKSEGLVLSYKKYGQEKLWREREMLAEDDEHPIEVDED